MTDTSARVRQLNVRQLEGLVNNSDESSFVAFLDEDPALKRLKGERERIERDNQRVAKETLDLEPKFSSDRQKLIDSCQTYTRSKQQFEGDLASLSSVLSGASPEEVLQQLRSQSEQKEDQSEEVTDNFLSGKCSIDQFLTRFMEERVVAHIFRVKSEQLSKLIRRDQPGRPRTAGFSPNPPTFPVPQVPSYLPSQPPVPQPGVRSSVPQW